MKAGGTWSAAEAIWIDPTTNYRYGGTDMRNRRGILACNAAAYDAVLPVAKKAARRIGLID